jgi:hypothetical protein
MMKKLFLFFVMAFLIFSGSVSCKKEISCEDCALTSNQPPLAVAGPDQTIVLPTNLVTLDGSASSDPNNNISSYLWTKIYGPTSYTIVSAHSVQTQINNLELGNYLFELKVTDSNGLMDTDTLMILVQQAGTPHAPYAHAGQDQVVTLPGSTVTLDGIYSSDPDNNISTFLWQNISGPTGFHIVNPGSVQTQVTGLVGGVYEFELKVTDVTGLSDLDTVSVYVTTSGSIGNVVFYFPDPTASIPPVTLWFSSTLNVPLPLVNVDITGFSQGKLHGVWAGGFAPRCPIITDYYSEPEMIAHFFLPPGTYSFTAESEVIDFTSFPPLPGAFTSFMSSSHSTQGSFTVTAGNDCLVIPVVF